MTGDESGTGPRSVSAESGTGFSRVPGGRRARNGARSRRTDESSEVSTTDGRGVLYATVVAFAAALLATGADEVLMAAASVDLSALVRGDPWLLMEADATLARAATAASRAAFLTRMAATAVLAWVGLRVAVRRRA